LHEYCLIALRQCLGSGNVGEAQRLLEMLGERYQTKKKIATWFCTFGRFKISGGSLIYRRRKDINKENSSEFLEKARVTPFHSNNFKAIKIPKLVTKPHFKKKTK